MTQVPSSSIIPIDNEKNQSGLDTDEKAVAGIVTEIDEDVASSDGDDALRLAGTHAHQFDEKYYLRLRRKIVCQVGLGKFTTLLIFLLGSSCHASTNRRLLQSIS